MAHRSTQRHAGQTLALLTDLYRRLSRLLEQGGTDAVETRLALMETACLRAREAAQVFYDETRISRGRHAGACPAPAARRGRRLMLAPAGGRRPLPSFTHSEG
jgi:fatty-acid peroxygenase